MSSPDLSSLFKVAKAEYKRAGAAYEQKKHELDVFQADVEVNEALFQKYVGELQENLAASLQGDAEKYLDCLKSCIGSSLQKVRRS